MGKESMRECHLCTIFKLYTNSFCRHKMGLKVLIKVIAELIFFLLDLSLCYIFYHLLLSEILWPSAKCNKWVRNLTSQQNQD